MQHPTHSTLPAETRFAPPPNGWSVITAAVQARGVTYLATALDTCFGSRAGNGFGILMYHRIAPHVPGLPPPSINVTPRQFRRQMEGLLKRGFSVWPLRRVIEVHASGQAVPANVTVVTFDDGFESVYTHAVPVLKDLNIPATIFINTAYINSPSPLPFDHWAQAHSATAPPETFRAMTREQCVELLDEPLIELGAHTHTHQDFRGRTADFHADLKLCVEQLKAEFGIEEPTFAFPYGTPHLGFATPELIAAAKSTGVFCALTTESTLVPPDASPFGWGRLNVFPWDNGATICARLHNWYSWAPRQQRRVAGMVKRIFAQATGSSGMMGSRDASWQFSSDTPFVRQFDSQQQTFEISRDAKSPPLISVIVPTYNRAHWLGDAIQSLLRQDTRDAFRFEVIIVDNASSDNTRQVVLSAAEGAVHPVRYLHQTKPGDAPTRNAGVRDARGEWFAFFDDDQLATSTWLYELLEAATATGSRVIGGPVHLDLPPETLERLGTICRKALREISFYPSIRPYTDQDLPGTGNALVARVVFERVGLFDETMTGGGSDSDLFLRARKAGFELWYTPRAVIRHRIPPERLSREYFRWDALSGGAGYAELIDYKQHGMRKVLAMAAARTVHGLLVNVPLMILAQVRGEVGEALGRRTLLWRAEGYVRQALALLAPRLFRQRAFFEYLEFRQGRSLVNSTADDAPAVPNIAGE